MKVIGREYKSMLDPTRFADPDKAVRAFWDELKELTETLDAKAKALDKPDKESHRRISFLDTPDHSLRRNGLVLRRRSEGEKKDEYTLKCRSEDRYFAAGTDVRPAGPADPDPETKLEEDIVPPFRCRFSHSGKAKLATPPATVGEAAATFPVLRTIEQDGRPLAEDLPLEVVHKITAFERLYEGASLTFEGLGPKGGNESGTVALIVWSNGKAGRPLVAEFSFRVKDKGERFTRGLAQAARRFFEVVLFHDWCQPDGVTKTEYIYRDRRGD